MKYVRYNGKLIPVKPNNSGEPSPTVKWLIISGTLTTLVLGYYAWQSTPTRGPQYATNPPPTTPAAVAV